MKNARSFTLVELVVCIAIFAMMTALVVAKFGTFNQSVLLTNLAYDTAITLRTAQTYGLSVHKTDVGNNPFNYAYGVHFSTVTPDNNKLTLFSDNYGPSGSLWNDKPDGVYESGDGKDAVVSTYTITRGAVIKGICASSVCSGETRTINSDIFQLDITFKRPNPDANICIAYSTFPDQHFCGVAYAQIFIMGTDGSTRVVSVRGNGQISVGE